MLTQTALVETQFLEIDIWYHFYSYMVCKSGIMVERKRIVEEEAKEFSRQFVKKEFEKSRYEGFEGMNYEQLRQPYIPRSAQNGKRPFKWGQG